MISFITLEPAANVSSASSHILPALRRDLSSPRTSIATSAPADIHACLSRSVTEAGKSGQFFRPRHRSQRPDWLADDAVSCELVSAPNSLLTGKLTGNF